MGEGRAFSCVASCLKTAKIHAPNLRVTTACRSQCTWAAWRVSL